MFKKTVHVGLILPVMLILSSCSAAAQSTMQAPSTTQSQSVQQNQAPNMANQPIEGKLAIGTLKMEGTAQAVTADQAKTLLPLWKAVKSMSASSTTSASEMTAVYQQIQEALTSEQVQAIKDLNLSQADMQALMQQYGVQVPQPGNMPTLSASQQATRQAVRSSSSGSNNSSVGNMGVPGDFGGMPPDSGSMPGGTTGSSASGQPAAQGTPPAGQPNRGAGGGMNTVFVDPLIKLLEQRAGV